MSRIEEAPDLSQVFTIKDSGERQEFGSGMVRDTTEGKTNFLNVRFGPMLRRWAAHLTKGRQKYPDPEPGVPNWTLAEGVEEYLRAKESASRHFEQWLAGERDEDHAAAVYFNINLAEYVLARDPSIDPSRGASPVPKPERELTHEERFPDLYQGGPYASRSWCEHQSGDGIFCERPLGHSGLHAARTIHAERPWGDDGQLR